MPGAPRGSRPALLRACAHRLIVTAAVVFGVALIAAMLAEEQAWAGWIPTTISKWQDSTVLATPAWAALAAYIGAPHRASSIRELEHLSERPRIWHLRAVIALGLAASLSQALVFAAMALRTGSLGRAGSGQVPWVPLAGMTGVVMGSVWAAVAWGFLCGRKLPSLVSVPAAAIAPYFLNVLLVSYGGTGALPALGSSDASGWDFAVPTNESAILRALWWVALAFLLVAVAAGARGWLRPLTWFALGALIANLVMPPTWRDIPNADDVVCVEGSPDFCVNGSWEAALPAYSTYAEKLFSVLPSSATPDRIAPLAYAENPDVWTVAFDPSSRVPHRAETIAQLAYATVDGTCSNGHSDSQWLAAAAIASWALSEVRVSGEFSDEPSIAAAAERLNQMDSAERESWFRHNAEAIRRCALDVEALP